MTNLMVARRPRLSSAFVGMQVLAIAAIAVAAGFVWVNAIQTLTNPVKVPPPVGSPQSLVWSGRVFTNRASLEAWLKHRGFSYEAWARKHGEAAAVVEHRPVVVAPHAPSSAKKAHKPPAKAKTQASAANQATAAKKAALAKKASTKSAARTPAVATTSQRSAVGTTSSAAEGQSVPWGVGVWLIALLLGAAALAPTRVLARVGGERVGPSLRTYFGLAAATIVLAMLLATVTA